MSQKSYDNTSTLYLIPTPIGNMDDLTFRSIETLKMVDILFCEDTRETGKLLKFLNISKKMIANHEHNEKNNCEKLLAYLESGKNVGLVSDRGTPIISDPGFELARFAIEKGYNVVGLPGACALIPALIVSGIAPKPFLFYGFLNHKDGKKAQELECLKNEKATMIFYEAPHRIYDTLKAMELVFGSERKIAISREITKKHEEIYRGTLREIIEQAHEFKGEIVIIVSGNNSVDSFNNLTIEQHIELYLEDGKSVMDAIKLVAKERSLKKSEVYDSYHKLDRK